MKTKTSDLANFFSDHFAVFFSLFLDKTPGTFAVSTAKKIDPAIVTPLFFFRPISDLVLICPTSSISHS